MERAINIDLIQYIAAKAITMSGCNADSNEYIKDILKVTCLILKEGNDLKFIHNSVQEYYSASYIRNRTDNVAKQFYDHCLNKNVGWRNIWAQELLYLNEIDPYRSRRYYTIPKMCRILQKNEESISSVTPVANRETVVDLIGDVKLGFADGGVDNLLRLRSIRYTKLRFPSSWMHGLFNLKYEGLIAEIKNGQVTLETNQDREDEEGAFISICSIIEKELLIPELITVAQSILDKAYSIAKEAIEYVAREENVDLNIPEI